MKVLVCIPCLNIGGTEIQTLQLVKALKHHGAEVTTLCYFEHLQNMEDEYLIAGSKVDFLKVERSIHPLQLAFILYKYFRKTKPDFVHIQYMAPGAIPIISAWLAKVDKIFVTIHQPGTPYSYRHQLIVRVSYLFTDKFICVSKAVEESWFGIDRHAITKTSVPNYRGHFTIHNAIDLELIDNSFLQIEANVKNRYPELIGKYIIGSISRLGFEKGIDLLLYAFAGLVKKEKELHLLIIGDGFEKPNLLLLAAELRILERISWIGTVPHQTSLHLMKLMDVVVCPSRFEGFGLTAAEAMAAYKPVIANNVGGLKEIIQDNRNGILVNAHDTKALTKAIQDLINNKETALKLGQSARVTIQKSYSTLVFQEKISKIYTV